MFLCHQLFVMRHQTEILNNITNEFIKRHYVHIGVSNIVNIHISLVIRLEMYYTLKLCLYVHSCVHCIYIVVITVFT